jgi:hypothetical protein
MTPSRRSALTRAGFPCEQGSGEDGVVIARPLLSVATNVPTSLGPPRAIGKRGFAIYQIAFRMMKIARGILTVVKTAAASQQASATWNICQESR